MFNALAAPFRWMAGRLRNRPDSEHEMSFNRLVFSLIIVVVLLVNRQSDLGNALNVMALYIPLARSGGCSAISCCFPASRAAGGSSPCCWTAASSWQLHLGGEVAALFFPIYLWVIFGNGFRFGSASLAIAIIPVATVCFGITVITTPFWYDRWHLSLGLLIGLVILPAYAGTLIRKLATKAAEEASQAKSLFLASATSCARRSPPLSA